MTLKRTYQLIVAINAIGLLLILGLSLALVAINEDLAKIQSDRLESLRLADHLRQTSDDLTKFARAYVITNEDEYKRYYQQILGIRNGTAPRPVEFLNIYWDYILVDGSELSDTSYGETISLKDMMLQRGLTDEELAKLNLAEGNSNALALIEQNAFEAVETGVPVSGDGVLASDFRLENAIAQLYSNEYHQAKLAIMQPIDEFYRLLDQRTSSLTGLAEKKIQNVQTAIITVVLCLIVLGLFAALKVVTGVLRPIHQLKQQTRLLSQDMRELAQHIAELVKGNINQPFIPLAQPSHSNALNEIGDLSRDSDAMIGLLKTAGQSIAAIVSDQRSQSKQLAEANAALAENRSHLEIILNSVAEGIHGLDANGNIAYENQAALKMFNSTSEKLLGKHAHSAIHHSYRDGTAYPVEKCPIYASLHDGVVRRVDNEVFWRLDGTSFEVEYVASAVKNAQGEIVGAVVAFRDVTEKRRQEQQLRNSEMRFRSLVTATSQIVWNTNAEGLVNGPLPSWQEYTGQSEQEIQGTGWGAAVHPEDLDITLEVWRKALQSKSLYEIDYRIRRHDGEYHYFHVSGVPVLDTEGNIMEWIGTCTDVTDAKLVEMQIQQLNKDLERRVEQRTEELSNARDAANRQAKFKSEFLANMSHEIRTPMTAILGLVDVLRHTEMNSKQQQYVFQIHNSSRALLRIINDILDISKIEAGKVDIEMADFSLLDTLEDSANLFASSADLKFIGLHLNMDTKIGNLLVGDRTRLSQVLNNLIGNAVKFTERGEVILKSEVLEINSNKTKVRFSVSDTGMGITEDAMARLFKAFEQADTATTRMYGGTGLGLAISYKLVELMGGELQARSVAGEGSEFWFDLEFKISDKLEHKLKSIEDFGKKVLLINSHPVASEILSEMLNSWNCKVNLANTADQALELVSAALASKIPYDFMLIDCDIVGDNFELIARIEEQVAASGIPVSSPILLLTEMELSNLQDGKTLPENIKVAIKPLTVSRLLNVLEEMGQISIFKEQAVIGKLEVLEEQLKKELDALPAPVRVLLAEDNKTNQIVIQELFSKYRIQFIIANNGKEAVEAVHKQEIDLVLMDLQMPIMDGFEATQKIRTFKTESELPILSLSAATFTEDLNNASLAGMNAHLSKPIDVEKVLAALLKWLPLHQKAPETKEKTAMTSSTENENSKAKNEPGEELTSVLTESAGFDLSGTLLSYLGPTSFLRMVKSFCEEFDEVVKMYRRDENLDMTVKRRIAHSLKSASANIGAIYLSSLATKTELATKEGNDGTFSDLMAELEKTLEVLEKLND